MFSDPLRTPHDMAREAQAASDAAMAEARAREDALAMQEAVIANLKHEASKIAVGMMSSGNWDSKPADHIAEVAFQIAQALLDHGAKLR